MPRQEEELVIHRLELAFEIEGRVEMMQLTPVEARHLQCSCIKDIVDAEAIPADKLKRHVLLL